MKSQFKFLALFILLPLFFSCSNDDDHQIIPTNEINPLEGKWSFVKIATGAPVEDESMPYGAIIWDFKTTTVQPTVDIQNNVDMSDVDNYSFAYPFYKSQTNNIELIENEIWRDKLYENLVGFDLNYVIPGTDDVYTLVYPYFIEGDTLILGDPDNNNFDSTVFSVNTWRVFARVE